MDKYPIKSKPVVYYRTDKEFHIKLNQRAVVWPVNHPDKEHVSNTREVLTSPVVQFNPIEGGFETMNTIYRPYKGEQDVH